MTCFVPFFFILKYIRFFTDIDISVWSGWWWSWRCKFCDISVESFQPISHKGHVTMGQSYRPLISSSLCISSSVLLLQLIQVFKYSELRNIHIMSEYISSQFSKSFFSVFVQIKSAKNRNSPLCQ